MFNSREKPKTTMVSQKLPIKTENPKDVEKKKLIKPTTLTSRTKNMLPNGCQHLSSKSNLFRCTLARGLSFVTREHARENLPVRAIIPSAMRDMK